MDSTPRFASALAPQLRAFLTEKRALGFRYSGEGHRLRDLDRHLVSIGTGHTLTKSAVQTWLEIRPNEGAKNRSSRVTVARQFARFLERQGVDAYIPPPRTTRLPRATFRARIFSLGEIKGMFRTFDAVTFCAQSPRRHLVVPELFRVLYGCGLRINEALSLRVGDVDLEQGVVRIRQGKFRKDRLVPTSASLSTRLRAYAEMLGPRGPEAIFFPAPDEGVYTIPTLRDLFVRALEAVGIPYVGRGNGPRIHDLRHTFAVHRLERWYREGADLGAKLPVLATYLGHVGLAGTQRYLQLTAEVFPDLVARLETVFGKIVTGTVGR